MLTRIVLVKPEFSRPNLYEFVVLEGESIVAFKGGFPNPEQAQEEGDDCAQQPA